MTRQHHLSSLANPKVKHVVRLREHRQRRKSGLFVAEGLRELTRAVQAGLSIEQVFQCDELLSERPQRVQALEDLGLADRPGVEHYTCTAAVLGKMAYLAEPEGVLAVVRQPDWSLQALPAVNAHTRYVVAVGLEKPGNIGAIARTAAAAGFDAVLVAGPVDAFNPNAIRASTCAVFALPVVGTDEPAVMDYLRAGGVRVMAATLAGAIEHTQADWRGPLAVVVGAEDTGLGDQWLALADETAGQRVRVPMRTQIVDSLNASNAAALLMFEAVRGASMRHG